MAPTKHLYYSLKRAEGPDKNRTIYVAYPASYDQIVQRFRLLVNNMRKIKVKHTGLSAAQVAEDPDAKVYGGPAIKWQNYKTMVDCSKCTWRMFTREHILLPTINACDHESTTTEEYDVSENTSDRETDEEGDDQIQFEMD